MRVALIGDIAFFGKYSVVENSALMDYFADVKDYLDRFDYVIGNLETPLTTAAKPYGPKSAHIKSHPANIEILRALGVHAVSLANNHMFDYGVAGYRETLAHLDTAGIAYFGVEGIEQQISNETAKIALHGYCNYDTNPLGMSRRGRPGINALNVPRVRDRIRHYDMLGYLNIVSIHSGQEHINYPSRTDIDMARTFAEVCPYVYFGHHPHVIQAVEHYKRSVLAYSLGNFCFDDVYTPKSPLPLVVQNENNRRGLILELNVRGSLVTEVVPTPTYAGPSKFEVGSYDITGDLAEYAAALSRPEPEYTESRNTQIQQRLRQRKASRDLSWYLKRLNFTSVRLLARAKYNAALHNRNVIKPLAGGVRSISE